MNSLLEYLFHFLTRERFKFRNTSYSQEGEDLFLTKYFAKVKTGYFIDVGAHHPKKLSNTYKFYLQGWRGLNIDAMPRSMEAFNRVRPGDKNIEIGIGRSEDIMTYFSFSEPALNTFSKDEAVKKSASGQYKIIEEYDIGVRPLAAVLDEHWLHDHIDFMSIDVEGLDLEVLQTNNWDLYRPRLILVEDLERSGLLNLAENSLVKYMNQVGYLPIGRTYSTLFFENNTND